MSRGSRARSGQAEGPDGIVVVDKPAGMTSHDVVNRLRRIYGTRRVGHTGTLDPLATGVLVVCLGHATRIAEYLTAARKRYVAGVLFGLTTDSEDVTGRTLCETDASALTRDAVVSALPAFRGRILQTPPMVSAVHHEGKRLYELARQGVVVEREAREVEIHALELAAFEPGSPARARLEVECSTGTYIRTLAADIGAALGVGGAMESLRRVLVGGFTSDEAVPLAQLEEGLAAGTLAATVRPIADALADWPRAALTAGEVAMVLHGQAVPRPEPLADEDALALLLDETGAALAIARQMPGRLAPIKVFSSASS